MDKADQYIERVQHLPPAPTILNQLLGLLGDPNRDIDRIVELIRYDPSLTAEVLKRCNSVFFRGAEAASDVFEAVTRMGFYEVYCVVVALVGARTMVLAKSEGALNVSGLWKHSVTAAVAAATLAERNQELEAGASFTAGLLHDVGKLVLASVESVTYGELLRQAGSSGSALAQAEEAKLGVTHAAVGARLLARWGLPAPVALAVLHHHHPPSVAAPYQQLAATIHLANILAHHLVDNPAQPLDLASTSAEAMSQLRLNPDQVATIEQQIQRALQRVEGLVQMTA